MRKLAISVMVLLIVGLLSGSAMADDLSFSGGITMTQIGSAGTPQVGFTFSSMTVNAPLGDTLISAPVSISGSFIFDSIAGSDGLFSPSSGTFSISGGAAGSLTADIDFVRIVSGGMLGSQALFSIEINLSNITVTPGTSNVLNAFGANSTGALTFQFSAPSGTGLSDLLNMGLGTGTLARNESINTSVSGTVAVPEPASLALLGTGLLAGGRLIRRKLINL